MLGLALSREIHELIQDVRSEVHAFEVYICNCEAPNNWCSLLAPCVCVRVCVCVVHIFVLNVQTYPELLYPVRAGDLKLRYGGFHKWVPQKW